MPVSSNGIILNFGHFLSPYFLISQFVKLNLTFSVCRKSDFHNR